MSHSCERIKLFYCLLFYCCYVTSSFFRIALKMETLFEAIIQKYHNAIKCVLIIELCLYKKIVIKETRHFCLLHRDFHTVTNL